MFKSANCAKLVIVAIDGPAGVGKSTVGRLVAKKLMYRFINSGLVYRALAWKALKKQIDVADEQKLARLAKKTNWQFETGGGFVLKVFVDGVLAYNQLRSEKVGKTSSIISRFPKVREFVVSKLRSLGKNCSIVIEGRDIATFVFPDAKFKIYLDASKTTRAKRRYDQLTRKGLKADYEEILSSIIERDRLDRNRKIAPLEKSKDSICIDTSNLSVTEVVDKIVSLIDNENVC
jgi:cytidylate kinase